MKPLDILLLFFMSLLALTVLSIIVLIYIAIWDVLSNDLMDKLSLTVFTTLIISLLGVGITLNTEKHHE